MNRLQLATLLSWAGDAGIQGRKRLQKVVFFLQQAGCPLDCRYTLHHFGPYSRDVADICDEMVAARLIEEKVSPTACGMQYEYKLTPEAQKYLAVLPDPGMRPYQELGTRLIGENLWQLELGSTVLLYYGGCCSWDDALRDACEFKKVDAGDKESQRALELAKRVQTQVGH